MSLITVKPGGGGDFTTIGAALASVGIGAGAGAGVTIEVYAGTYLESISNNLPSGTSWGQPFILRAKEGHVVTIKATGESNLIVNAMGTVSLYALLWGFIFDGTNLTSNNVTIGSQKQLRLDNVELIHNEIENAIYGGNGQYNQFLNCKIHGGAFVGAGGGGFGHGIYIEGDDNLVQGCQFYDIKAFGVHVYSAHPGFSPSRNLIAQNDIYNFGLGRPVAAGILLSVGDSNQAYKNRVHNGVGGNGDGGEGIMVGFGATNSRVIKNTVYSNTSYAFDLVNSTGTVVQGNNYYSNGSNGVGNTIFQDGTTIGATVSGNTSAAVVEQQFNTSSKLWEIKLTTGTVITMAESHLLNPIQFGDWLFFLAASGNRSDGTSNGYYARQISTGVNYRLNPNDQIGGPFEAKYDGSRYVTVAFRASQGKYYEHREVLAGIFDTSAKAWKDFSAQPLLNRFTPIANPTIDNVLWVHNGNQTNGYENTDPGAQVERVTLISPTVVEWVTMEPNAAGAATAYNCWRRTITIPSGAMSAITAAQTTHAVSTGSPIPTWL